jgi:hypothetical protein
MKLNLRDPEAKQLVETGECVVWRDVKPKLPHFAKAPQECNGKWFFTFDLKPPSCSPGINPPFKIGDVVECREAFWAAHEGEKLSPDYWKKIPASRMPSWAIRLKPTLVDIKCEERDVRWKFGYVLRLEQ